MGHQKTEKPKHGKFGKSKNRKPRNSNVEKLELSTIGKLKVKNRKMNDRIIETSKSR